jgi:hypothetical protein
MAKLKKKWMLLIGFGVVFSVLSSCGPTQMVIKRAHLTPKGQIAQPALVSSQTEIEQWEEELKPKLQTQLQNHVFGYLPDQSSTKIISHKVIAKSAFNNTARLEEYELVGHMKYGETEQETAVFNMVIAIPLKAKGPVPVILNQTFCPNHNTIPNAAVSVREGGYDCSGGGIGNGMMKFVFGRFIATPPIEMIMERGYALATIFPSEFVPDSGDAGLKALKMHTKGHDDDQTRLGAIGAWAWGYSRMIDALMDDPQIDSTAFFTIGHSRYGKSALVATAYDPRIAGVIAHQSGTGGASLNRNKEGETVGDITESYPHWFSQKYASYAGHEEDMPVDQHALLALIAPRPIFLGNARRDTWSDPNGAFRAAIGASPVYKLYGKQGLSQAKLKPYKPDSDIAFYIRGGTHGIVKEDWPAFLAFLDAHTK